MTYLNVEQVYVLVLEPVFSGYLLAFCQRIIIGAMILYRLRSINSGLPGRMTYNGLMKPYTTPAQDLRYKTDR